MFCSFLNLYLPDVFRKKYQSEKYENTARQFAQDHLPLRLLHLLGAEVHLGLHGGGLLLLLHGDLGLGDEDLGLDDVERDDHRAPTGQPQPALGSNLLISAILEKVSISLD